MTEEQFFADLQSLSLQQLSQIQQQLSVKIEREQARKKRPAKMLIPRGNITEMADNLGLDLSALIREASKR